MIRSLTCVSLVLAFALFLATGASANCTQGFWKNHPENWCTDSLALGNVIYNQEELLSILGLEIEGNGLVSLAHQLIAAKLNLACGASDEPCIDDADALIGDLVVPPVGAGHLPTETTSPLIECLTAYNESTETEPCRPISVEEDSWGQVKATYR